MVRLYTQPMRYRRTPSTSIPRICARVFTWCVRYRYGGIAYVVQRQAVRFRLQRGACRVRVLDGRFVRRGRQRVRSHVVPTFVQLWSVAGVVSVASLHAGRCGSRRRTSARTATCRAPSRSCMWPGLCVRSVGLGGYATGRPVLAALPCSRIEQSSAMACAVFDGSISRMHGQVKHVVQTGVRAYATFSVIGDGLLGGIVWRDGERIGVRPSSVAARLTPCSRGAATWCTRQRASCDTPARDSRCWRATSSERTQTTPERNVAVVRRCYRRCGSR